MLLSDGKFDGDHTKSELTGEILEILYSRETHALKGKGKKKKPDNGSNLKSFSMEDLMADDEDEDEEIDESQRKFKLGYWRAQKLKRLLHLDDPIENIMTWDEDKIYDTLVDKTKSASTASFEIDYSKCLIFVSGNIDEAYKMSGMVDDADISADIVAANSKKINIIDIKKALKKRFKPEQISRLGNTHIIYPSLNSQNYKDLINKTLNEVLILTKKSSQINIFFDNTIVDFIYKNGVFPVQGVRPVFSTISSVFNNTLPKIILWATENHKNTIELTIVDKDVLTVKGSTELRISLNGCIDQIKRDFDIDKRTLISVHEAGHAVVYSDLFKVCPQEIKSSITSWSGGYMLSNDNGQAKEQILNSVAVILAGRAAEKVVFGDTLVSAGATSDIKLATAIVMNYLRGAGLDDTLTRIVEPTHEDSSACSTDIERTCKRCENILQKQLIKADEILKKNMDLFKNVSKILIKDGEISPEEYKKLAATRNLNLEIIPSEKEIFLGYKQKFDEFSI
jgi:cell division protease FtsH